MKLWLIQYAYPEAPNNWLATHKDPNPNVPDDLVRSTLAHYRRHHPDYLFRAIREVRVSYTKTLIRG